jgi:death-on-curing protein
VTRFLTLREALRIAEAVIGETPLVRDVGLVESALARPRTTVFGQDAYPTLELKAAALLQWLATNHPLVDGNERLAFACTSVFLTMNGAPLTLDDVDEAYDVVIAVSTSELTELADIARALREGL